MKPPARRGLRRLLSPDALKKHLKLIARRFPLPLIYLSAITIWLCLMGTEVVDTNDIMTATTIWGHVLGQMLSLAINIWTEYLGYRRLVKPLQLAGVALVIADFAAIVLSGSWDNTAAQIGRGALFTALAVAIVFIPVARGMARRGTITYTFTQIGSLAMAFCLSVVLSIAVMIITGTFDILFGLYSWKVTACFLSVFSYTVPVLLYLGLVPSPGATGRLSQLPFPAFIPGACKYVLLPLAAIYTAILYVYAAKILLTLTLPNGQISYMVTGLATVVLVVIYGLQAYTVENDGSNSFKIAAIARRLLPPLLIPLLVLMSVGLCYRLGEYGPTASRLYVAAFNIWAYVIVAYIIIMGSRANLNSVAISFAAAFVAISIIPGLNVSTMANTAIRSSVIRALDGHNRPMTVDELKNAIAQMPTKQGTDIASKIAYLDDWGDHNLVADIVKSDSRIYEWELLPDTAVDTNPYTTIGTNQAIRIPQGYTSVYHYENHSTLNAVADSNGYAKITIDSLNVNIPVDSITRYSEELCDKPLQCTIDGSQDAIFVLSSAMIYPDPDTVSTNKKIRINLKGYIFRK